MDDRGIGYRGQAATRLPPVTPNAMKPTDPIRLSKFLARVLRHEPEAAGLRLDPHGWVRVEDLLRGLRKQGLRAGFDDLVEVVETNDKRRYEFGLHRLKIRAVQGHSVPVDLGLIPSDPPELLFHGTVVRNLDSIFAKGLTKGARHHVHLSPDVETAERAGGRWGKAVVLRVFAADMALAGHEFYRSANGVWLTDAVLPRFIGFEPTGAR